jgi:hypothetical protein
MLLWDQTANSVGQQNIGVRFYDKTSATTGAFGVVQPLDACNKRDGRSIDRRGC